MYFESHVHTYAGLYQLAVYAEQATSFRFVIHASLREV